MDCRETQTLLTAFHDGELPAADRARVEEHLRGCRACGALLADLARADQAAGVPDPGPGYWDRFNARVMDRVEREADGPRVAVLRPKHGWMRQQLRYLVPAAAAAALVVVVVRYVGMHPDAPTPAVPPAVAEPESRATKKAESTAVEQRASPTAKDGLVPRQAGMPRVPQPRPPVLANERIATVTREERERLADRSLSAGNGEASRDRASAPAAIGVPSPPPMTTSPGAPDGHGWPSAEAGRDAPGSAASAAGSPPVAAEDGMLRGMQAERKMTAGAASPMLEQQVAGKAKSASGMRVAKEPSPDGQGWPSAEAGRDAPGFAASAGSPCELARTLAGRGRWREAETTQRACLAQDRSAPAQEKGLVFLAELLDRQERFAEADAVITEVDRQFPQSRPLDLYRRQRPMVQKQPMAVPDTR